MTDNPKRRQIRRATRGLLCAMVGVYLCWLIGGCAMQRHLIYPRYAIPPVEAPSDRQLAEWRAERIPLALPDDGGAIDAWLIPGDGVSAERPGPLVVFAHGNAELIDFWPPMLSPYRAMGVSVLLVEYRGYGRSAGKPSEKGIVADFDRAIAKAIARPGIDGARLVYHGRSLGGGVLASLSRKRPPAAMIMQSTFTSIDDFAKKMLIPPLFVRDHYRNTEALAMFEGPVLIMHGEHDSIIPFTHAQRLHAAAPNSTIVGYPCDHNDFPVDSPKFWADVERFLREADLLNEPTP